MSDLVAKTRLGRWDNVSMRCAPGNLLQCTNDARSRRSLGPGAVILSRCGYSQKTPTLDWLMKSATNISMIDVGNWRATLGICAWRTDLEVTTCYDQTFRISLAYMPGRANRLFVRSVFEGTVDYNYMPASYHVYLPAPFTYHFNVLVVLK